MDMILLFDCIVALMNMRYSIFDLESLEVVVNIYKSLDTQNVNRKHIRTTINDFTINSEPNSKGAFNTGCRVSIKENGKKGVIVAVKSGGWRKILSDGKCSMHRPRELDFISTSIYSHECS